MVNIMVTGPGVSAPYPKLTTISPPPAVFPQLTQGGFPPSHSELPRPTKSAEGSSSDVDSQMDGIDDDLDSYGSDFGPDDPPGYLEQESDVVVPKPTASFSPATVQPSGSLSNNNCVVCNRSKSFKDFATCGAPRCDQELKSLQGFGSSHTNSGPSSNNRCPVCDDLKPNSDKTCGKEFCHGRVRYWEGFPNNDRGLSSSYNPQPSFTSGASSYSAAVQTRSQTQGGRMCEVCHQRPRYSHNGKTYPTCGLTCAAKLNPSGRVEMCDLCRQRPKVVLNGKVYPHCGRTCRDKAKSSELHGSVVGTCITCVNCWKAPANLRTDEFCSDSCRDIIEHRAPLLLELPRGHSSFDKVEKEFKSSWTVRKAPCPSIKKVYMVCIPSRNEANFEDYSKKVSSSIMPGGLFGRRKEEFRWIPGQRGCALGHPGITTPCELPQCELCNILRGTYIPEMFGKGISTMSLPRATHNYELWAANSLRFRISKVVLLSKVCFGKVVELDNFQARSGPPHGANSVKIVNYAAHSRVETDEILVYGCEALRPAYLVSYD